MKRTNWIAGLNVTVLVQSLRNMASNQQAVVYHYAVPFPTRLVAGLSSRRHDRSLRSNQVGLVVHTVALVQVLTRVLQTFHVTVIHQWCRLHHSSIADFIYIYTHTHTHTHIYIYIYIYILLVASGTKTCQIFRNHVERAGVRGLTWRKFHSEDAQILRAIIQIFVARLTWRPEFVHTLP